MDSDSMKKVIQVFRERDNFLVTAHVNPEGDSIGSQLAILYILEKMGKNVCVVDHDRVPENMKFLPGSEKILSDIPGEVDVETLVLLDCPVRERTGNIAEKAGTDTFTVNIDHHVSNEYFGDVNWVEPGMSSVGEMAYFLAREAGVGMSRELAMYIYAAMITDTGMFNYDNTSGTTHRVAGELVDAGVEPRRMHSEIYEKKKAVELRVLGKVLSTMQITAGGKVAYIYLTRKMYKEEGSDFVATEEFINYPRSVKGVEIAVFFKENAESEDRVNVSFRSAGRIDVNRLASVFGGGGHPAASGCMFAGGLEQAIAAIMAEAGKAVDGPRAGR